MPHLNRLPSGFLGGRLPPPTCTAPFRHALRRRHGSGGFTSMGSPLLSIPYRYLLLGWVHGCAASRIAFRCATHCSAWPKRRSHGARAVSVGLCRLELGLRERQGAKALAVQQDHVEGVHADAHLRPRAADARPGRKIGDRWRPLHRSKTLSISDSQLVYNVLYNIQTDLCGPGYLRH